VTQIRALYRISIQQTKEKVYEDIDRYLEAHAKMPSYEQYVIDREKFIVQIWTNAWLNIVSSRLPIKEKKAYLTETKSYEVDSISKKQVNQLFRNEMRNFEAFDVIKWLTKAFGETEGKWVKRYQDARGRFLIREQERREAERRNSVKAKLENCVEELLKQHYIEFYVYVRYFISAKVKNDLDYYGYVTQSPYTTIQTFFDNLTEDVYANFHWSQSHDVGDLIEEGYESKVLEYLIDKAPELLIKYIPNEMHAEFSMIFEKPLTESILKGFSIESLYSFSVEILVDLLDEYLTDLIELEASPFDFSTHKDILRRDKENRVHRQAVERAERARQKEEEALMLKDIFGTEYSQAIGHSIQFILHVGDTNTGKTFQALQKMKAANSGLYLGPLRLLALEVYDKLNSEGVACSLKTGEEEKIEQGANHMSCTVEMFHEKDYYEVIVIDESQMIADKDRGFSWFKAITKANAKEVHIIGSYNMKSIILQLLGDSDIKVNEYSRDTPLEVETREFSMKHVRKGDALVCFSRKRVLETASQLQKDGFKVSMIYGSMPPETRKKQIQMFSDGVNTVIVATDAIGMGLNLPIRRIVFLENEKFDGIRRRRLTSQEVKQIAGRAGRKGLYDVGEVAFSQEITMMSRLLHQDDEPLHTFAIAPTAGVLERFQKYSRNLGDFFEMWEIYESPEGTKKATLFEEYELYETIRGSRVEARLSMMDLYGFLHLPFSSYEPVLSEQWRDNLVAIVEGKELPEPLIKTEGLEELEHTYKSVGLHLLFLYRLDKRTETVYWEKIRDEISDLIHEILKTEVQIKQRKCRKCGDGLPLNFKFHICESCHNRRFTRHRVYGRR
jgi:ATP-dependent RNA helicase SUPV3L1/SUV3